jgi:hypothetical protein
LASPQGRHTVLVGETGAGPGTGVPSIDVVLARGVRWTIKLNGGAGTETVDMGRGDLSDLTFGAEVSTATVELPPPNGTETVTMAGGARPIGHRGPARSPAFGGAGRVLLDGSDHTGVAGGSVFSDPGWSTARNRYAVDLTAGVSDFRMSRS